MSSLSWVTLYPAARLPSAVVEAPPPVQTAFAAFPLTKALTIYCRYGDALIEPILAAMVLRSVSWLAESVLLEDLSAADRSVSALVISTSVSAPAEEKVVKSAFKVASERPVIHEGVDMTGLRAMGLFPDAARCFSPVFRRGDLANTR